MTVSPSGIYAERLDEVRDLIAASAAFRTWTGTADAAAAKLRTHPGWFRNSATRPLALVDHISLSAVKATTSMSLDITEYMIGVAFHADAPTVGVDTDADEVYSFLNTIAAIDEQMRSAVAASHGSYPDIIGMSDVVFIWPDSDETEDGKDRYEARYTFKIGGHL